MNRVFILVATIFFISEPSGYSANIFEHAIPVIQGKVTISGTIKVGNTIKAEYVYHPDNHPESGTTFRWYLANTSSGSDAVLISSAGSSIQLLANHENKYIRVELTPRDVKGTSGENYSSAWYGPIQKADQVNNPPVATNVRIRGNPVFCGVLTGMYDYTDPELDAEDESSFRWLRASAPGSTPTAIPGATSSSYTISADDKDKYIFFEVTPKARSGNTTGNPVTSTSTAQVTGTLPSVTFTGNASICEGSPAVITLNFSGTPPFNLEYTNGAKSFTLSTSNSTYALTVTTGGTYTGTRLTDILNCPVTNLPSSAVITSKPKPVPDFSVVNGCYNGDTTLFRNTSQQKNTIKSWSWNFGDNGSGVQNTSAREAPGHKYPGPGNYKVWLAAENNEGCRDTTVKTVLLEDKPVAGISWDKSCFSPGMTVTFKDNSTTTGKIKSYSWTLRNATQVVKESASEAFSLSFPSVAAYQVELKISTESGCRDSTTRVFAPKNIIRLKDSMYTENLEGSPLWHAEMVYRNNWSRGKPAGATISSPHSGNQALFTSFPEKRQHQQMIISGPCFDFTSLPKPFIDIWINNASQPSKEGAVVQYMQDGSGSWTTLGQANSGQNWYNATDIASRPGGSLVGWSGSSNGWVQARHSLEMLANKTNVQFRLVYASWPDASGDGFAVDDIFIGQRSKKVLVEHFTNLSDVFANQVNISKDSIITAAGAGVTGIQYHTSFPGTDSLNESNKAHASARALFYGVGKVPVSYLDGGSSQQNIYDYTSRKLTTGDIANRSFEDPGFELSIDATLTNSALTGSVKLTAMRNFQGNINTLHIVVVEDINVTRQGKTVTLSNVMKFMYPSSGGTALTTSMVKDQSVNIPFSWTPGKIYNPAKLKIVAFVQNNTTKEVLQVETAAVSGVNPVENASGKNLALSVYPNPAADELTLLLPATTDREVTAFMISMDGSVVKTWVLEKGTSIWRLAVTELPSGIYYLQLKLPNGDYRVVKVAIVR